MKSRWALGLLFGLVLACGGTEQGGPSASAGTSGAGGASASTGGSGGALATCPGPAPASAPLTNAGRLDLPVSITINGAPAEVGVPGVGRDGREYRLSLFKFFVSEPALVSASGVETPAQLVSTEGTPLPHGVHLVDADDASTQQLHLATEVGSYTALRLGVGVPARCNSMQGADRVYPLNVDSDMFWPWGSQFMFIRIEGNTRPSATAEWASFMYHVGFDPAFATLTIPGSLAVASSGTGPTLSLDLDLMLATGGEPLPEPKHAVPDGWVVDNLESNQAFTLK